MTAAPRYLPHYTVADYQRWEGDWELIDGIAFSMSPSPFGPHERIISRLSFEIMSQLRSADCECAVYTNLDWIVSNDTVIRPDLMVVCGVQPDRHLERPPSLAVEVLSDSTRGRDLTAKRSLCREYNVPNYVIIDPVPRTLLLVTPDDDALLTATDTLRLSLGDGCDVVVDCSRLFD